MCRRLIPTLGTSFLLVACGGGSSSSGFPPPSLIAKTTPNAGTTNPQSTTIAVTLSGPVDTASLSSDALTVTDASGNSVDGIVSVDATGTTIVFEQTVALRRGATYDGTLAAGVRTTDGGELAMPFRWSFAIADATPPVIAVLPASAQLLFEMRVGIDDAGAASASWSPGLRLGGNLVTTTGVEAAFAPNGGRWARLADAPAEGSDISNDAAYARNGAALCAWRSTIDGESRIHASARVGTGWTFPVRLDGIWKASFPKLAVTTDGRGVAVWGELDGVQNRAMIRAFDGGSWGEAIELPAGADFDASFRVAMADTGEAIAVFRSFRPHGYVVVRGTPGGSWRIDRITTESSPAPFDLAMSATGHGVLAWSDGPQGGPFPVHVRSYFGASTTDHVELASAGSTGTTDPQVVVSETGEIFVSWREGSRTGETVLTQFWAARTRDRRFGPVELADEWTTTPAPGFTPYVQSDLVGNPRGRVAIVWSRRETEDEGAMLVTVRESSTWQPTRELARGPIGYDSIHAAMNAFGVGVVGWSQPEGQLQVPVVAGF